MLVVDSRSTMTLFHKLTLLLIIEFMSLSKFSCEDDTWLGLITE